MTTRTRHQKVLAAALVVERRNFLILLVAGALALAAAMTIGELLNKVPRNKALWDERSPLNYVDELAGLSFPLRIYWSSADTTVGNQGTDQSGKLYKAIKAARPSARVKQIKGTWAHSAEFVPGSQLSDALLAFGLIDDV